MYNTETLIVMKANNAVVNLNLTDITHEESLLRAGNDSNCINWILGHIIQNRDGIRAVLNLPALCSEEFAGTYQRGTAPVTSEFAVQLSELIERYNEGQKEIEEKISETDYSGKPGDLQTLTFLAFHESYHVGQIGILRRVTGKSGAIK